MEEIKDQLNRIENLSLLAAKQVLTLGDVALLTGLSRSSIYKFTCSHTIPYYKPNGKLVYFDRKEIESWMRQNRIATTDEIAKQADNYLAKKGGLK